MCTRCSSWYALCCLAAVTYAHQHHPGNLITEDPPSFSALFGNQTIKQIAILDANWRWLRVVNGSQNCCDGNACSSNCVIEGVDAQMYKETYGVSSVGDGIELQYVSKSGNVGSRLYLGTSGSGYTFLKLKNKQLSVEVDVSDLPCGLNSALYLVRMSAPTPELERLGVGYGDAQCPKNMRFVGSMPNHQNQLGSCATEIDLIEANSHAFAWTLHPCSKQGACANRACDDSCDTSGADSNPYREGFTEFYGPKKVLNSSQPFVAVTQFITADGTDHGPLVEIRRFYVQNGMKIVPPRSSMTDTNLLQAGYQTFMDHGGFAGLSRAFEDGLVLVFSIWDDPGTKMQWLDGFWGNSERGPCKDITFPVEVLRRKYGWVKTRYRNLTIIPLSDFL